MNSNWRTTRYRREPQTSKRALFIWKSQPCMLKAYSEVLRHIWRRFGHSLTMFGHSDNIRTYICMFGPYSDNMCMIRMWIIFGTYSDHTRSIFGPFETIVGPCGTCQTIYGSLRTVSDHIQTMLGPYLNHFDAYWTMSDHCRTDSDYVWTYSHHMPTIF